MNPHAIADQAKRLAKTLTELSDEQFAFHAGIAKCRTVSPAEFIARESVTHTTTFAIEAIRRRLDVHVYDEQVIAAIAMIDGGIAEMQTGEGKTIAGAIAAIVHAFHCRHVHVATANEYLARRDWQTLSPAFELLGLSTGFSFHDQSVPAKQSAYRSDVVFATGYQFGFDYLRDQLALTGRHRKRLGQSLVEQLAGRNATPTTTCTRGQDVAIVDEIDAVLIDEAMTPLVLSGVSPGDASAPSEPNPSDPATTTLPLDLASRFAAELNPTIDYIIDPLAKTIQLTTQGLRRTHEFWSHESASFTAALQMPWPLYVQAALRAEYLLHRDADYVVRDGEIQIVDASTGRIAPDRQWRDGLHQAVETKEGVPRSETRQTLARISRQRYFARYQTLGGMTGTAAGLEREWKRTYSLPVHVIATRLPSTRIELPTIYVSDLTAKLDAILHDVNERHEAGQPILIGTRTIAQTRQISRILMKAGWNHRLLNGIQDEAEADLIAAAGRGGAITVATNMAGRGTDIAVDEKGIAAGGLHVIGFERNLSARIDRQLLGRAARQGQPGSGRFFVAADDELVARYDTKLQQQLCRLQSARSNGSWDQRIAHAQRLAESQRYETRQRIAQQEEWLNELRKDVA